MTLKLIAISFFLVLITINNIALSENKQRLPNHTFLLDDYDGYMIYDDPEKGEANAKVLLDKYGMIFQLVTPTYNIHGVETAPSLRSEEEKVKVNEARNKFLRSHQDYIKFTPSGSCHLESLVYTVDQIDEGQKQASPQVSNWHHYNVKAELYYSCDNALPENLNVRIFDGYPRINKINAQYIAHGSDLRRANLTPEKSVIQFTRTSGEKLSN